MGPCGNLHCDQDKKEELSKPIPYVRDLVDFGRFWVIFRKKFYDKEIDETLFSELGIIFSKIFPIIWAFKAL